MRCFYQKNPTRRGYRKQMIAIWREIRSFEKPLIIDVLKALMIKNETEEQLTFKKVYQRRLSDVTKKVNAVIRYIEKDDVTQTNLLWQPPFGLQKKLE